MKNLLLAAALTATAVAQSVNTQPAPGQAGIYLVSSGGVTVSTLVTLDSTGIAVRELTTSDHFALGIAANSASSGAYVTVYTSSTTSMPVYCMFDGTSVVNDFITISTTVAGDCHDTGVQLNAGIAALPSGTPVIGISQQVVSSGSVGLINLFEPGLASSSGGGGSGLTGPYNVTNQIVTLLNGSVQSVGAPFSMGISCTAAGNFEVGYVTTSPNVCTLSYANGTAASASVSDGTQGYTQVTPYTLYSGAYPYSSNTNFTATATATNSQTANAGTGVAFYNCTFSGLSTGAAPSGATRSGSGAGNQCASETSTLAGGLGTLTSNGLGNTNVGQVFSFASPGGNYVTLLLTENSSGCNRNPFTFNGSSPVNGTTQAIPSYTNILSGTQPNMCLYTFGPYSSAVTLEVAH